MLTELLKNSFRATVENHWHVHGASTTLPLHPVVITLSLPSQNSNTTKEASGTEWLDRQPFVLSSSGSLASETQVDSDADPTSYFSLRIRDTGGGVPNSNLPNVFSYAFTTAGRNSSPSHDDDLGGGPYAAQQIGGLAGLGDMNNPGGDGGNLFEEITGKGMQTGVGTIAGLGYGLPMSRLYAK